MQKKRLSGLDIVRSTAIIFVILLHSTSLSGVFDGNRGAVWGISLYLRHLCMSCVPLFLMLSGYLQRNKRPSISYYLGIIPLYISYVAISILCIVAYAVQGYMNGNMDMTFTTAVYKILDFSANGYAWYFEMYIGLFLLIPFLNLAYSSVLTKRGKLILIISLAFLTLLPDTLSGFAPYYSGTSSVTLGILPDFFKSLYPVTYYYIGSYIAEYKPRVSAPKKVLTVLCAPLLPMAVVALCTHLRGGYAWYMFNGFQTLAVALTAVCVFLALYDIDVKQKCIASVFSCISVHTFEIYMLSYLWDTLLYSAPFIGGRLPYIVTALLVFVASFLSAVLLLLVLKPLSRFIVKQVGKLIPENNSL